jgi:hypothetical protein
MAIKKCPYCKAFIDEKARVCSNCGTQLLFPEDEFIEEDIPGEKITDKDIEKEEEPEEGEFEPEELDLSVKDEEEKPTEVIEEKEETEIPETSAEEEKKKIEDTVDEFEEAEFQVEAEEEEEKKEREEVELPKMEAREKEKAPPITPEENAVEEPVQDLEEEKEEAMRPAKEKEEQIEAEAEVPEEEVEGVKEEVPPLKVKLDFKTRDLAQIPTPKTMEKEQIDEFLRSLREKEREETSLVGEERVSPPAEIETEEKIPETEGELPPWAKKIMETPTPEVQEEVEEREEEEVPETEEEFQEAEEEVYEPEEPAAEPSVSVTEEEEQKTLPFIGEREIRRKKKPRSRFLMKLKAVVFDFFFISALWFISVLLASRLIDVSFFRLISVSIRSVVIYYGVLVISYFSLFLFFLGETLGNRIFFQEG